MPWVVGIDEAGYGPNLGPLVQAAVAVRLPDPDPAGWDTLRPHVRRAGDKADARVLVDDSKKVHQGKHGLAKLERGLIAAAGLSAGPLADWLRTCALPGVLDDLAGEHWFDPAESLPLHPDPPACLRAALAESGVEVRVLGLKLVPAGVFNRVVAGSGSKATVLAVGLVDLLMALSRGLPAGEPAHVVCDQLGGRRYYAGLLQAAFPGAEVTTECETAGESRYRVDGAGRAVGVVASPRADAGSVSVALASMACKYLREVCMRQFNRFWLTHVPGLKPTAGYPGDAGRFFAAIRPAMATLGIADEAVWRVK